MIRKYAITITALLAALMASGCYIYFGDEQAPPSSGVGPGGSAGTGDSPTGSTPDEPTDSPPDQPGDQPGDQPPDQPPDQCGAPSAVILDCAEDAGYQVDSWQASSVGRTALHLVSVYETIDGDFQQHPQGEAHVDFRLPGSNVLALSAYEPTRWVVDVAPGARLQKIVVFGYHEQVVSAPARVQVEIHDTTTGSTYAPCGYSLPYNGGGCDTDALIADVEAVTGLALSSFHGCYHASEIVLASSNTDQCL
jgi:hypothetical protein